MNRSALPHVSGVYDLVHLPLGVKCWMGFSPGFGAAGITVMGESSLAAAFLAKNLCKIYVKIAGESVP